MLRFFLSCGLCLCSLMLSLELHRQKSDRAEIAKDMCGKLSKISARLRFEAATVYDLSRTVFSEESPWDYSAFKNITIGDFQKQWCAACNTLSADTESKKLFIQAGCVLGSCDLESQLELLSQIRDELSAHADSLQQKAEGSKKLYTTLGALIGAAAAIIVV